MAKGKRTQETKDLEDELRNMILGNVRISSEDHQREARGGSRYRGRGSATQWAPPHLRHQSPQQATDNIESSFSHGQSGPQTQDVTTTSPKYIDPGFQVRRGHSSGPRGRGRGHPSIHHNALSSGHAFQSKYQQDAAAHDHSQTHPRAATQVRHGSVGSLPVGPRQNPQSRMPPMAAFIAQCEHLDHLAAIEIPRVEMSHQELVEKDLFRLKLESLCREEVARVYPGQELSFELRAYGSVMSGFATKGSDVDLTIIWSSRHPMQEDLRFKAELPRIVEDVILKAGHGARLLSKTRVPIIKVCERPTKELHDALSEERTKWEQLPSEEKYPSLAPVPDSPTGIDFLEHGQATDADNPPSMIEAKAPIKIDPDLSRSGKKMENTKRTRMSDNPTEFLLQLASKERGEDDDLSRYCTQFINARTFALREKNPKDIDYAAHFLKGLPGTVQTEIVESHAELSKKAPNNDLLKEPLFEQYFNISQPIVARISASRVKRDKPWLREKALGKLDFPKSGVGIQCDINFSNPLSIHNTELLRLYSLCDNRVRPMVLFVKAWTKQRKINSAYSGTLSSYGYVLMVLHFLINITQPPVLPNLQHVFGAGQREVLFDGYNVSFYRDESTIRQMAATRQWTGNTEPLGVLLRNFFHYYAATGNHVIGMGFNWMKDVIAIRNANGLITKEAKGWTGARTVTVENREVRQRYLLAIEDPFEVDHNVGRPVTHNGIVTIRDEFRRAWRILTAIGRGVPPEGQLFDHIVEESPQEDSHRQEGVASKALHETQ